MPLSTLSNLFSSARKVVFPANGDWLSQIEKHVVVSAFSVTSGRGCGGKVICHKNVRQQFFMNQNLDLPPPLPNFAPAKILHWVWSQSKLILVRASKLVSLVARKTQYHFIYVIWKLDLIIGILEEQETYLLRAFPCGWWVLELKHPE